MAKNNGMPGEIPIKWAQQLQGILGGFGLLSALVAWGQIEAGTGGGGAILFTLVSWGIAISLKTKRTFQRGIGDYK